jgi:adenine deaminase
VGLLAMGRCGLLMLQGLLLPVLIVISSVFVGLLIPDTYLGLKEDLKKALRWEEDETADIVYVNATIWTGNPRQPWAEFMAVVHGQVSKIGNSSQIQFAVISTKTKVVDLGGRFVVPGFIDSHVHFISGGLMVCEKT